MYEERFMKRAIALSREALTKPGTQPFAAVVVKDGAIVGEGINHSAAHFDPTSHGETEAIRDACRKLQCVDLSGCDLYSSCEPCALCVATMHITGIGKLYYAASLSESGAAFEGIPASVRHPIDVEVLTSECSLPVDKRRMPAEKKLAHEAIAVLEAWASLHKRA